MPSFAIEMRNVTKDFKIYHEKNTTLKERVVYRGRERFTRFRAVDGVSLEVAHGAVVGLIGRNGSGKSTLLKLATRILYPDTGVVRVQGKVSSLLELGAGFHPDFTGRENIYMNASIMGFTRREITRRIDDIVAFSELGSFIDNPVRGYSSGMYTRLAFSIAINVEPDILLLDEVLAVGDFNFQQKCLNRIREFKEQGKTIMIVSHDLSAIERLCDTVVWMDSGKIRMVGNPVETVRSYLEFAETHTSLRDIDDSAVSGNGQVSAAIDHTEVGNDQPQSSDHAHDRSPTHASAADALEKEADAQQVRWGNKSVEISDTWLEVSSQRATLIHSGDPVHVFMSYRRWADVTDSVFGIGIFALDGTQIYGTNTFIDRAQLGELGESGMIRCMIDAMNLVEGRYWVDVAVHHIDGQPYDYQRKALYFDVRSPIKDVGFARLPHSWRHESG